MKDLAGNVLKVGDRVARHAGGRRWRWHLATVVGFTAKMVHVEYRSHWAKEGEPDLSDLVTPGNLVCIRELAPGPSAN